MNPANDTHAKVIILNADEGEAQELKRMIQEVNYHSRTCHDPTNLGKELRLQHPMAVILDLDNVALDNRMVRNMAREFPEVCILCCSRKSLHPELKEAIRDHIFACLMKPVDPDELHYWLKCIHENNSDSRGPPDSSG